MTAGELADRLEDMPPDTEVVFNDERMGLMGIEKATLKLVDPLVVTLGHGIERRRIRRVSFDPVPKAVILS